MIIYTNQRSKKKNKTKKEIEEYQKWLDSVGSQKTTFAIKKLGGFKKSTKMPKLESPEARNPKNYPSVDSGKGSATKPVYGKVYTGTKMKGIGTLHKSNAVPIFTDQEAKDQAAMRR